MKGEAQFEDGGEMDDGALPIPAWVVTFGDMMSLLMCFFVLLLSFSEIEQKKYKQVAGSMEKAFGVQREIPTKEIPKGTSMIAREFSPGKPDPTAIVMSIRQQTTNEYKSNLDFTDSGVKGLEEKGGALPGMADDSRQGKSMRIDKKILHAAILIAKALKKEIEDELIEVIALPTRVAIRIREKGSFDSGSAEIQKGFFSVLDRITTTLEAAAGEIIIAGHTDDRPIATYRFPSNWELSAARASALVHYMTRQEAQLRNRIEIRAHGEMRPIVANDSAANRAINRRVEISLVIPLVNDLAEPALAALTNENPSYE